MCALCVLYVCVQVLRVTVLEAEGLRNVAVLKKSDTYVVAELVTNKTRTETRTAVMKVTLFYCNSYSPATKGRIVESSIIIRRIVVIRYE